MGIAYAHGLYADIPPGHFQLKWAWDPTLIFFVIMLVLYLRGLRAFKGRAPVRKWQKGLFFTGIAVMAMALLPPIDPLSDQLFSAHMTQHLLITCVGVPLIIFGVPFFVVIRGMPAGFRRRVYIPLLRSRIVRRIFRVIQKPLVALFLYEGTFWFWHVPRFYNMALLNDAIHLVEHACMAFTAMNLWRIIIDPYPMRSPLALPWRALLLAGMTAADVALSAALTYSETVWYAYEGMPMPPWWIWSHAEDQRLGGLIMWIPGGFIEFLAMTITFFVWAHRERQADLAQLKSRRDSAAEVEESRDFAPSPT